MMAPGEWIEYRPAPGLRIAVFSIDAQAPCVPTDRELLEAPRQQRERAKFLARRYRIRRIIAQWLGRSTETIDLGRDLATGAPKFWDADSQNAHLFASLAGRGNFGGVALASAPVGFDLEWSPSEDAPPPAWNVLHREEIAHLANFETPRQKARGFMKLWTAKEAYLKFLQTGLNREPREIAIIDQGDDFVVIDGRAPMRLDSTGWRALEDEQEMIIIAWALGAAIKNNGWK